MTKDITLRQDRYFILVTYRDLLKKLRRIKPGNCTQYNTPVSLKMINIIQRRYEQLQLRYHVYNKWE
jgi:hypothetical protein